MGVMSEEPEDVKPKLSLSINYEGTRASLLLTLHGMMSWSDLVLLLFSLSWITPTQYLVYALVKYRISVLQQLRSK